MHSFNVYEAGGNTSEQGEKKKPTHIVVIFTCFTQNERQQVFACVCRISVVEKDTNMHQDHICNEIV